jgi:hypothetical protein
MKKTQHKKLKLNLETLRNLKPEELGKVVGGLYPTETQEASGCNVTMDYDDSCGGPWSIGWC